jgi:hypothetical protein
VRWYPATWSLHERKERERFQAALYDIPVSMTAATLFYQNQTHPTLIAINGFKAFKVITSLQRKKGSASSLFI